MDKISLREWIDRKCDLILADRAMAGYITDTIHIAEQDDSVLVTSGFFELRSAVGCYYKVTELSGEYTFKYEYSFKYRDVLFRSFGNQYHPGEVTENDREQNADRQ